MVEGQLENKTTGHREPLWVAGQRRGMTSPGLEGRWERTAGQNTSQLLGSQLPSRRKRLSPVVSWASCLSDSPKLPPPETTQSVWLSVRLLSGLPSRTAQHRRCVPLQPWTAPNYLSPGLEVRGPSLADPVNGGSGHLWRKAVVFWSTSDDNDARDCLLCRCLCD